jgi:hypothetical protein
LFNGRYLGAHCYKINLSSGIWFLTGEFFHVDGWVGSTDWFARLRYGAGPASPFSTLELSERVWTNFQKDGGKLQKGMKKAF